MLPLYMDVHVCQAITEQLRQRGLDVMTAIGDGAAMHDDGEILDRARSQGRLLFTHDVAMKHKAEVWQREGKQFAGVLFGHPLQGNIGRFVSDLERIARSSELAEWANAVEYIPIRKIGK